MSIRNPIGIEQRNADMINNIDKILPHFYFNEGNEMFMHCQIVQRAKDHKGERVREGAIKTYFIRSREHLKRVMPEIILLCEHYGARAYINLAAKDFDKLQKLLLVKLASDIHLGNIRNPRKCLNSAAGELKSRRPMWIVDIDDISLKEPVLKWLDTEFAIDDETSFMYPRESVYFFAEIPTVQGCHLIVKPFNLKKFSDEFSNIDVHKNSMGTLLYYPKSLDKDG